MNGERDGTDVGHFKNLSAGHAGMDEVGSSVNSKAHAGEFRATLDPAADVVRKGNGFDSNTMN